jgi:hypothetical protein
MHNGVRAMSGKGNLDLLPIGKFAFDEMRPGINGGPMAFTQVVENGNFMPLIQQELGTNAPDVTCAANHKDFHWRKNAARSAEIKNNAPTYRGSSRWSAQRPS